MIPFFQWTQLQIGPVTLYTWGFFVALGIIAALWVGSATARKKQLDSAVLLDAASWTVIAGIVGARVGYVAFAWNEFAQAPLTVFALWNGGMSITGGILFGAATIWLFFKRKNISSVPYIDLVAYVLPLGMAIGRIGCFVIYDHPGVPTSLFFGQVYADGIARHNLGLELAVHAAALFACFVWLERRNSHRPPYFYVIALLLGYNIPRFLFDFLRSYDVASDPRYFGLTFAQYTALFLIVVALVLWYTRVYDPKETAKKGHK